LDVQRINVIVPLVKFGMHFASEFITIHGVAPIKLCEHIGRFEM